MIKYSYCGSLEAVKNGIVRGHQHYHCRQRRYHFTKGDLSKIIA